MDETEGTELLDVYGGSESGSLVVILGCSRKPRLTPLDYLFKLIVIGEEPNERPLVPFQHV
jgi:hypothetical protein